MIYSCVASIVMLLNALQSPLPDIGGDYEIRNCVYNSAKKTMWVEATWEFNTKKFSGTTGRTTVNYQLDPNCRSPRRSEMVYIDDLSKPLTLAERRHIILYRMFVRNTIRYFSSDFCLKHEPKS